MSCAVTIRINGHEYRGEVTSEMTLLDFIRGTALLTGTKKGCNNGDCGACAVLLDGKTVLSCMLLAAQADGCNIVTIEGVAQAGRLHPAQQAFVDSGAIQCGYCTPGMVMATLGLLAVNPSPTEEEIRVAMVGHLCRCGGYKNIVKAIDMAAKTLSKGYAGAEGCLGGRESESSNHR